MCECLFDKLILEYISHPDIYFRSGVPSRESWYWWPVGAILSLTAKFCYFLKSYELIAQIKTFLHPHALSLLKPRENFNHKL